MLTRSERLALALCSFVGIGAACVTVGYAAIFNAVLKRISEVL
jgi:hypothetical protein